MPLVKSGDKKCSEMVCTGARDGLDADHALFLDCGRGCTKNQPSSGTGIRSKSGDREIFVVEGLIV